MQEKSIIKQNILKYLEFIGITPYKFYQETGITRGILSQNNGMSEENTARILDYYKDIDANWLLTGMGNMLKSDNNLYNAYLHDNIEPVEQFNYKDLADARFQIIEMKDEKILRLEKELSELKYTQKEPFLYKNVAESAPELTKKEK
ncbi:hypothetical protein [Flavobacterium soyangense]|uniref:Uncharacterized protein n=1 Tax=Flavobacterium soyangense TaxID=2023265 RepID=A0A930XW30_9FLAO|nr:hypothetical protein [Flavobacterium soyangense]MBF2708946.1 hypothetical protein [Flavobacterium soyangense]